MCGRVSLSIAFVVVGIAIPIVADISGTQANLDDIAKCSCVIWIGLAAIVPYLLGWTMYVPGMIPEKNDDRAFVRPYFALLGAFLYLWGGYLLFR